MNDKLFYIDKSIGLRKTYADLLRDVNLITSIPSVVWYDTYYQLFTMLVAAKISNTDLALSQYPLSDSEANGANTQTTAYSRNLSLPLLAVLIASSTCKIGVFTSGTTGRPKLVHHRTETLTRSVQTSDRHQGDVWGLTYHPASFAGLQVFFQAVSNSNPIVRLAELDASAVHKAIDDQSVSHISSTPTWMRLICSDKIVHDSVRHITTGGEIADRLLIDQIVAAFPNATFRNVYASTESGSLFISDGDSFQVPAKLAELITVTDGMLAIHRSLLAESLRRNDGDEFFVTGDCVEIISTQPLTLRFTARKNDWINVGGYKVNPIEVEQLLVAIDGVADARVFGRKNSVMGNIVCCEIVRSAGAELTIPVIRRTLEDFVPTYKVPRIVDFVEAIVRTQSGKKYRAE